MFIENVISLILFYKNPYKSQDCHCINMYFAQYMASLTRQGKYIECLIALKWNLYKYLSIYVNVDL